MMQDTNGFKLKIGDRVMVRAVGTSGPGESVGTVENEYMDLIQVRRDDGVNGWCEGLWTVRGEALTFLSRPGSKDFSGHFCMWCSGKHLWLDCEKRMRTLFDYESPTIEITKQKAGKPEYGRLLEHVPNALLAAVAVRKYGNDKYAAIAEKADVPLDSESWKENPARDYLESAMRHVAALFRGERINAEDGGCHHAAQAIIDLCFFFEIEKATSEKAEGPK